MDPICYKIIAANLFVVYMPLNLCMVGIYVWLNTLVYPINSVSGIWLFLISMSYILTFCIWIVFATTGFILYCVNDEFYTSQKAGRFIKTFYGYISLIITVERCVLTFIGMVIYLSRLTDHSDSNLGLLVCCVISPLSELLLSPQIFLTWLPLLN